MEAKSLAQVAQQLFEDAQTGQGNRTDIEIDAFLLVKCLREGGRSKKDFRPEVARYLSHFQPDYSAGDVDTLLMHFLARHFYQVYSHQPIQDPTDLDVDILLFTAGISHHDRGKNFLLQNCFCLLLEHYGNDYTERDVETLIKSLKGIYRE